MSNKLKVFIIVCVVVFLTGLAATIAGMALHGWRDLDKLPGDSITINPETQKLIL